MIKRLTPILFLLVYTFSVVGSTIERTQAWVGERAHDSKHHGRQYPVRINEWHRRAPRPLFQTKILEDGSFVISPFIRTNPPQVERALQHFSTGSIAGHIAQVFSTRAPPATIS
jgi:hypothetical protein